MPRLILVIAPLGPRIRIAGEILEGLKKDGYDLDRRLASAQWDALFEEAMTPGLFASKRVFLVEDGVSLGAFPERFSSQVESDEADVVFLLLYEKDPKKDIGPVVYAKARIVRHEPAPSWPSKRREWLMGLAREQKIRLDPDAASLMVEWIDDEEELRAELRKLHGAAQGGSVSRELVQELAVDEGSKGILNLLEGIAKGKVSLVVEELQNLRENGELIVALSAVEKRVRAAYYTAALGPEAAKALKLTPFQARTAADLARRFSPGVLAVWLGELIRLSWSERTGDGEDWNGLERTVLGALSRMER